MFVRPANGITMVAMGPIQLDWSIFHIMSK